MKKAHISKALLMALACMGSGLFAQLPGVVLSPSNLNQVHQYEKVEVSVDLANVNNIGTRVDAFLTGVKKPATQEYNDGYTQHELLNPYDPAQIHVTAHLTHPGSPPTDIVKDLFFYRNYQRTANDWQFIDATKREWRLRFAPDQLGDWQCTIRVEMDNTVLVSNYSFTFHVISGTDPGFVRIGRGNGAYFSYSGSRTPFIPMGQNYGWPEKCFAQDRFRNMFTNGQWDPHYYSSQEDPDYVQGCHCCKCTRANCANMEDTRIPANTYSTYAHMLQHTATYGGDQAVNTVRIFMTPWGFLVEWNKLGNYDPHQIEMWELDQIFTLCESLHVKVILTFGEAEFRRTQYPFPPDVYPTDAHLNGWEWDPYFEDVQHYGDQNYSEYEYKGIAGVSTFRDFMLDPTARIWWKNRLRYIEARWGYSTSLFAYDMFNEDDQLSIYGSLNTFWNSPGNKYYDGWSVHAELGDWLNEMFGFLKHDLNSVHLTTSCLETYEPYQLNDAIALWQQPNLDFISHHSYGGGEGVQRGEARYLMDYYRAHGITKPVLATESGQWTRMEEYQDCVDIQEHNKGWADMLAGYAGPRFPWPWRRYNLAEYDFDLVHHTPYDPHYGAVDTYFGEYHHNDVAKQRFMGLIDLDGESFTHTVGLLPADTYTPGNYYGRMNLFEHIQMKGNQSGKIYGWVHNRSSEFWDYIPTANEPHWSGCLDATYFLEAAAEDHSDLTGMQDLMSRACVNDYTPQLQLGCPPPPNNTHFDNDGYVSLANFPVDILKVEGLPTGMLRIPNVQPNRTYRINWYYTWGSQGGTLAPMFSQSVFSDPFGQAGVAMPPTGYVNGTLYPGDWAYTLSLLGHGMAGQRPEDGDFYAIPEIRCGISASEREVQLDLAQPCDAEGMIIDMQGRSVQDLGHRLFAVSGRISLPTLPPGVYIIRLDQTDGIVKQCRFAITR